MDWHLISLLLLIITANGAPIIVRYLIKNRLSYPIDCGYLFLDNKRLLGHSKTWRGLISALFFTSLLALLMGYEMQAGIIVAAGAMSGDLLSSFIKRRLNMPPSSRAPLLDQIPESLIPALLVMQTFHLSATGVLYLVIIFFMIEYVLSRLFYYLGIRRKPY